jgi:hypothetical protein
LSGWFESVRQTFGGSPITGAAIILDDCRLLPYVPVGGGGGGDVLGAALARRGQCPKLVERAAQQTRHLHL